MIGKIKDLNKGYFWIRVSTGTTYFASFAAVTASDRRRIRHGTAVIFEAVDTGGKHLEAKEIRIYEQL